MAGSTKVTSKSYTWLKVQFQGASTSTNYDRQVLWYIEETGSADSDYIYAGESNSGTGKLTGLDPGECYEIVTEIYRLSDGKIVAGPLYSTGCTEEDEEEEEGCVYLNNSDVTYSGATYDPSTKRLLVEVRCRFRNDGDTSDVASITYVFGTEEEDGRGTGNVTVSSGGTKTKYYEWVFEDVPNTGSFSFQFMIYGDRCITTRSKWFEAEWEVALEDFYWGDGSTNINSGDKFETKVTEAAWKDLCTKVSELTGTSISTSSVYSGGKFLASHYNTVANALGVSTVSSGDKITAAKFNALRNAYQSQAGLS